MNPRVFLDDQFPTVLRPLIPSTLKLAYKAAEDLIADNPMLESAVLRGERGRIVAWSVDAAFSRLVDTGALPFDKSWEYYERPTGRYLALRASASIITISQVSDPVSQPRNVAFRQNKRLANQPFLDLPGFEDEVALVGEPHILLTHGYQNLSFAHLCIPDPEHGMDYRYRTNNLMSVLHEVQPEGPPPEDTDYDADALAELKQDVERYRRDNADTE